MYLRRLDIENLRSLERVAFEPNVPGESKLTYSNVTLLLGNNGLGKTSVLRAVALAVLSPVIASSSGYVPYSLVRRAGPDRRTASIRAQVTLHREHHEGAVEVPDGSDRVAHRTSCARIHAWRITLFFAPSTACVRPFESTCVKNVVATPREAATGITGLLSGSTARRIPTIGVNAALVSGQLAARPAPSLRPQGHSASMVNASFAPRALHAISESSDVPSVGEPAATSVASPAHANGDPAASRVAVKPNGEEIETSCTRH